MNLKAQSDMGDDSLANSVDDGSFSDTSQGSPPSNMNHRENNSRLPQIVRAFRHRNYRLFFGGQIISLTGTWMQNIAQSWLVYRLTGSAVLLGFVVFAGQLPIFLFATFGGVVADRFHRHRILLCTQTACMALAFILALLTLSGIVQVWHLFILAVLLGIVNAFDIPARQAFVVDMVGPKDLVNAIALNSSIFNGARIIGPAIAGVIVAAFGEGWCFFLNAVSYLAVLAGLLLMNIKAYERTRIRGSTWTHIVEGFNYVGHTRPIRALLLLLGLISLMGMPYHVLMPIFADEILHGGVKGLGLLMGASGVGAFTGALVLASRKSVFGLGRWLAISAAGFGVSLILFSFSRFFWLSFALLIPVGFSMMINMASSNTLIQSMSPNPLRGRVMAVHSMIFMGMAPPGALYAGFLAHHLGAPITVALGGAACIAGACLFGFHLPALREEGRRIIVDLQMENGVPVDGIPERERDLNNRERRQ